MTIVPRKPLSVSIAEYFPEILSWWVDERYTPYSIGKASRTPIWLRCNNGHLFQAKPMNVSRHLKVFCRECFSINFLRSDLVSEMVNPEPDKHLLSGSHKVIDWICLAGHSYSLKVNKRTGRGDGCYYCSNHRILLGFNDLRTKNPEVASMLLDQTIPETIHEFSNKSFELICNEGHVWLSQVSNVSAGRRCDRCSLRRTSSLERFLVEFLSNTFELSHDYTDRLPIPFRSFKTMSVDSVFNYGEKKVVVEYDGSYWHKDSLEKDYEKTKILLDAGYLVVRIREQSSSIKLPMLSVTDNNLLQLPVDLIPFKPEETLQGCIDSTIIPWILSK